LRLVNTSTDLDFLNLSVIPKMITRGTRIPMATASFLLTLTHFRNSSFGHELIDYTNISKQVHLWKTGNWKLPHTFPVHFKLHMKSGLIFPISFDLSITAARFENIRLRNGYITWHSTKVHTVSLMNPHDC
jgi:hypothetical protein